MEWVLTIGVLGLLCIFAEVFLPGGVLGVFGWLLIGTSLVAGYKLWGLSPPFLLLAAGFIAGGIVFYAIAIKIMPKTPVGKLIFLRSDQKGYNVELTGARDMVGKEGIALSFLRPSGFAQIEGKRVNVVTEGEFIEKNAKIKVCRLRDNNLIVRKTDSESQQTKDES